MMDIDSLLNKMARWNSADAHAPGDTPLFTTDDVRKAPSVLDKIIRKLYVFLGVTEEEFKARCDEVCRSRNMMNTATRNYRAGIRRELTNEKQLTVRRFWQATETVMGLQITDMQVTVKDPRTNQTITVSVMKSGVTVVDADGTEQHTDIE